MKIVMEKLGISDEKLASFQTVSDEKSCFEEDIQDLVNRIFKFVTDNRLHDIFRAFGFSRAASSSRQAFEVFARQDFSTLLEVIKVNPIPFAMTLIGAIWQGKARSKRVDLDFANTSEQSSSKAVTCSFKKCMTVITVGQRETRN